MNAHSPENPVENGLMLCSCIHLASDAGGYLLSALSGAVQDTAHDVQVNALPVHKCSPHPATASGDTGQRFTRRRSFWAAGVTCLQSQLGAASAYSAGQRVYWPRFGPSALQNPGAEDDDELDLDSQEWNLWVSVLLKNCCVLARRDRLRQGGLRR